MTLDELRIAIAEHPSNAWAKEAGYEPLYAASAASRIAIISQAPGRKGQETGIPWNDASGARLRSWLDVSDDEFYDPDLFALVPMDFYFPGKGKNGDLPPRADFAPRWHPVLFGQLPNIRLTILVGSYAQRHYLADRAKATLTATVMSYRDYLPDTVPLVHPSPLNVGWHLKNPWFESDVIPDLRPLVRSALRD